MIPAEEKQPNQPIAKKLPEMDQEEFEHYSDRVSHWFAKHQSKQKAVLTNGKYLYHATKATNIGAIQQHGLCPRDPEWKTYDKKDKVPRFDASKDGYLSMATTRSGAGAMGGTSVVLRMLIGDDIADWDFRVYSATEVRTLKAIPPNRLEWSKDGNSWTKLSTS